MPLLKGKVKLGGVDDKNIKIIVEVANNNTHAEMLSDIAHLTSVPVMVQIVSEQLTIEDAEAERQAGRDQLTIEDVAEPAPTVMIPCPVCGESVACAGPDELQCQLCGSFFPPLPWKITWLDMATGQGGDLEGRFTTKEDAEEEITRLKEQNPDIEYVAADFDTVKGAFAIVCQDDEGNVIRTYDTLYRTGAMAENSAAKMRKEFSGNYIVRPAAKDELSLWAENIIEEEDVTTTADEPADAQEESADSEAPAVQPDCFEPEYWIVDRIDKGGEAVKPLEKIYDTQEEAEQVAQDMKSGLGHLGGDYKARVATPEEVAAFGDGVDGPEESE